jgi:CHAT domain-containing protein
MKPSAVQRLAAARDEEGARKCFTAPVKEAVWQLAQKFESAHLWRAAAVAFELARLAAEATGDMKIARESAARGGFISSFMRYQFRREVDPALAGLRESGEAFATTGGFERAISTFVAASRIALRNGRPEQSFAAAGRALDLLSSDGGSDESSLLIYSLARDIFKRGAGRAHAVFFARANSVFKLRGEVQYAACAAAWLGCTLVRSGDIESGLEILNEVEHTLRRAGLRLEDGGVEPVPEVFLAAYWTARGNALTGRLEEAVRAFRDHQWWDPRYGNAEQRDKLVSRTVEVLIELERYNDALELLNERLNGNEVLSESGRALLLSQVAVLDALLGRPMLAADKISEVRELVKQDATSDDMSLRARLQLLDASLIARCADAAVMESELSAIESESAVHQGEIMLFEVDRIRADLALTLGNASQAIAQYQRALEGAWSAPADQTWAEHYRLAPDLAADFEKTLHARRIMTLRKERGVGLRMEFGIARAKVLGGQDPTLEIERVIEFASAANRRSTLFYALYEKAKAAVARCDPAAVNLLERCIDILESLRADIRDVSLQIGILADKERVYGDLLELAVVAQSRTELAMRVTERAKARGLLDEITAGRAKPAPLERDVAAYLRRKIVRLLRRQFAEGDETGLEIRRTKQKLGSVFQRQYSRAGTPVSAATPNEIASFTAADTAVLHYFIDRRGTFACVAASGELQPPILLADATPDTIAALLGSFAFELKTRQAPRSLEELYAILVEPLRAGLYGISRLLVLPHRILHRVPFHALLSGDGRYVAEDFVLSYAPSASYVLRSGGPVQHRPDTDAPSVVIGVSRTTYLPLENLEDVQREVAAVAERLDDRSVLQDNEVSRRALLSLRGDVDVLHLACHGEFDEHDPLLSRLYLADGPVYAYELLALDVRPHLIVLSACESGVRVIEAGDESFGLIRPLLTTGCDAILSSLWRISDRGAAALMKVFYEQRRQFASDAPRCLAETQRALIRSEEYAHPYYWAPYLMVTRRMGKAVQ